MLTRQYCVNLYSRSSTLRFITLTLTQCARHVHGSPRHVNTDIDNTRIPWDFTTASYEHIHRQILPKYPRSRKASATIPLLHLAQQQNGGWIPVTAMFKIARICEVPPMHVFETVTFYSMFNRHPVGKYYIQFCRTTPCMLCGGDELLQRTLHYLGVKLHGTTPDKLFTIGEMECLGACVNAPMLVVSDYSNPPHYSYDYIEDLTWEHVKRLIDNLRNGKPIKVGTQRTDRRLAQPPGGRTSLFFAQPPGPYCRNLDPPPPPPPAAAAAAASSAASSTPSAPPAANATTNDKK